MKQTNEVINELIDLFTGKVMTKQENEVLYKTVALIHDLEDQTNLYKSFLLNQPGQDSNH